MEEYFIIAMIGIFSFMFLFIAIFGGRKAAGLIGAIISAFGLGIFAMAWYSGREYYLSQIATTTGASHAMAVASLNANDFNGEVAMLIFALAMAVGLILYFVKSKEAA